jgi:DNA-binding CsgD family transcriptional regulator
VLWAVGRRLKSSTETAASDGDRRLSQVQQAVKNCGLTAREAEVAYYAYRGYSARGTGDALGVSEHTVKNHLANAYRKLGVHSKQELIEFVDNAH